MRFVVFLFSLGLLASAMPVRRTDDVLGLISALDDGLKNGQSPDVASTAHSLPTSPTDATPVETKNQIAVKTASIISHLADGSNNQALEDLIVGLEKSVPGVDSEIYRILNVGTIAKLRANGGSVAPVLNQADVKAASKI
ncbi:hypothetical protein BN14_10872 [Rhizoctonia solani AG-1 IB]|uniref:Uncharacterized protein n=1 Tax=Thanatephorus cucumeris (strain AG1-IB / isolate 7/3/14) TaxID=1108050 RepID=M5CBR6_THACB|nr:hypothetical protein BN14_10872 [Rhizoctonia solani AG-1 IB]